MRVLLNLENFRSLVRGGVVKAEGVEIALADIGFTRMAEEITTAIHATICPACRNERSLIVTIKDGKCPECGHANK